ncbi:hypothetical protein TNCV_643501 [Trichonephila clavipes]|nr:hypothetical protein TNCV_643501 [Trichonephila clavipes]
MSSSGEVMDSTHLQHCPAPHKAFLAEMNEKITQFCVTVKERTEVVFTVYPRIVTMSECLNQMHKEEKSFVKEKKKEKLAERPVEKVTKKQKNSANSLSTAAKSPSEYK